jgi:4-hydroxy-4-methyl-2-oxoglutarate aldolase
MDAEIKPLDPASSGILGSALPCEPYADDNLAILAALSLAKPGDVLVCQAEDFRGSAVVGDNIAMMARNAGVAGIIVNGLARDLDGIIAVGLPVFARGVTPNSCVKSGPGRVGLPIVCGGVAVNAGDVIVADRDGVVVVPQAEAAAVGAQLEPIRAAEAKLQARIRDGLTTVDAVKALLASDRVKWID